MKKKYNKKINKNFYSKITGLKPAKTLTQEEFENCEQGYVLAPFIIAEHTEESLKNYHEFMDNYNKQHEVCPKCGENTSLRTLMGYVLDSDKREEYKDLNDCVCGKCGDKHTVHDRISIEQFKII